MLKNGTTIEAGQQITAWVEGQRIEISNGDTPHAILRNTATGQAAAGATGAGVHRRGRPNTTRSSQLDSGTKPAAPQADASWTQLCRDAAFGQVLREANERGLHNTLQTGTLADLVALAEAARLTRSRTISHDTCTAIRERFSGTTAAAEAAFYLGKMAFDQRRAFNVASTWFERYLREDPQGRFSRDALGRLIEAQQKSGRLPEARQNARVYLEAHPGGTHAAIARDVLNEEE
jgi:hypothetical protein